MCSYRLFAGRNHKTLISSRDNQLIKEYTALRDLKNRRREKGLFAVEGARLSLDAVSSGTEVTAAFLTEKAREKYADCCAALENSGAPVYEVTPAVADCLADTRTSQGIFCIAKIPEANLDPENLDPRAALLALEDIQDPGNLGTILRTAEAMGINGVILSAGCTDPYAPKAVRASMGAVFRIRFFAGAALPQCIEKLKSRGIGVYAAVADGGKDILSLKLGKGTCAVIGNEGNGLTKESIDACTERVTVRMRGRAESLNAAAAATVIIWEMTKGL